MSMSSVENVNYIKFDLYFGCDILAGIRRWVVFKCIVVISSIIIKRIVKTLVLNTFYAKGFAILHKFGV